jgi:hypothetical protein
VRIFSTVPSHVHSVVEGQRGFLLSSLQPM